MWSADKYSMKKLLLYSNSGQSLVSVLVSLAISGIIITIMLQLTGEQNKSIKYFTQKSEILEMRNQVAEQLGNSSICDWQFSTGDGIISPTLPPKINASALNTQQISFSKIYMGNNNASPEIVAIGTRFSGLVVTSITYRNLVAAGVPGRYQGDIEIAFDPLTAARAIAPIKIKKFITVDTTDPATAQSVLSCTSSNTASSIQGICRVKSIDSISAAPQTVCCDPGEIAMGGHAPLDVDYSIGWANERCMAANLVGAGPGRIQLRCCK